MFKRLILAFKLTHRSPHYVTTIGDRTEDMYVVVSTFVPALVSNTNSCGCVLLRSKLFLLSPAPIQANTRGGDQKM